MFQWKYVLLGMIASIQSISMQTIALANQKGDLVAAREQARDCYTYSLKTAMPDALQNVPRWSSGETLDNFFNDVSPGSSRISVILRYGSFVNYIIAISCSGGFDNLGNPIASYCVLVTRNSSRAREEDDFTFSLLVTDAKNAMARAGKFLDSGPNSNCD